MKKLVRLLLAAAIALACAGEAAAMQLTDRSIEVEGRLDVKTGSDIAGKLVKLDASGSRPIYLFITATDGSAQGVMIVADTIRSLKSPVVAVVMTQIHGTGASLAPLTDQVVMFPSAGLVFTELDYEGVKKADKADKDDKPDAAPTPATPPTAAATPPAPPKKEDPKEILLQEARARFMGRLYARLSKRVGMDAGKLQAAVEAGGLMMSAEEAVSKKVAASIVESLTYVALPVEKLEIKVTTTSKETRSLSTDPSKNPVN